MSKNTKGFIVGFIVFLVIIALVVVAAGNSESVMQEKSVDASDVYSFSFVSQEAGRQADSDEVYYSDSFFSRSNSEYDHELARASLALSMTTFKKKFVASFLEDMGYEDITSYRYGKKVDEDKVALTMAHKDDIVVLAVRSGLYGDEWGSNGRIGYDGEALGYHYGFRAAAEDAVVQLKDYAAERGLNLSKCKLWITGFSRGAAVANVAGTLLADGLEKSGDDSEALDTFSSESRALVTISPENLFCYTFASPNTVSADLVTGTTARGLYNIVNPLDIVTRLPMNASGISESAGGNTVRYSWDYVKYGTTLKLPTETETSQLQMVQLLENALAFATRNEQRYVEKTQDQVIIPSLKKAMGKGADISKRNVGAVLIDALPGVAVFLRNEVEQLDFMARVYVAGILSGKKSIRLEKEHWPETYWGWMVKVENLSEHSAEECSLYE